MPVFKIQINNKGEIERIPIPESERYTPHSPRWPSNYGNVGECLKILISAPMKDVNQEELKMFCIDYHRFLFQTNKEIPGWLSYYLDGVLPNRRLIKYWLRERERQLDHSNPAHYGFSSEEATLIRDKTRLMEAKAKMQEMSERLITVDSLIKFFTKAVLEYDLLPDIRLSCQEQIKYYNERREEIAREYEFWKHRVYRPENRKDFDLDKIQKVQINRIIGQQPLSRMYGREKYLCPLHKEKTPSFVVWTDENRFHCFGCGEGGNVIDLYMKLNGVDFKTACRELEDNY